jgi:hypothetical protein
VRIDFYGGLGAVDPTKRIRVVDSGNALICLASCFAARAKGQHNLADRFATFDKDGTIGGQAGWDLQQIINAQIKAQQSLPVRRQPYFGRDRYSNQDYWSRGR